MGDDALVREVIAATSLPRWRRTAELRTLGMGLAGRLAVREATSRARLWPAPDEDVVLGVELVDDGKALAFTALVGPEGTDVVDGSPGSPDATLRQDAEEFVVSVFGPEAMVRNATQELHVHEPATPPAGGGPAERRRRATVVALRRIQTALSGQRPSLTDLAVAFGADKWGGHWYTPHYERYFGPLREDAVTVLEIGIGGYTDPDVGGASLLMWKHFFRRGMIYGLDIHPKRGLDEPRLWTLVGDQSSSESLRKVAENVGGFDIVIDDGSHISGDVIATFADLAPWVRPGGLYVIEDTQTSYWPGWGGSATPATAEGTSMALVKNLLDGLNHQEQVGRENVPPSLSESMVSGVHAHHNLVVIEFGSNAEQGAPDWVPRMVDPREWYAS